MLLAFPLVAGGILTQRFAPTKRSSGHYFSNVSPSGDTLLVRLRDNASYRAVSGTLTSSNRVLEISGTLKDQMLEGIAFRRVADKQETNLVVRASLAGLQRSLKLNLGKLYEPMKAPLIAKETHTVTDRRFKFGRYGATRKASASVPQIEDVFLASRLFNERLEAEGQVKILEFQSGFWNLLIDSFKLPGMSYDWVSDTDLELQFVSEHFASVKIWNYSFTGGAHGNTSFEGMNFYAPEAGKLIRFHLLELFENGAVGAAVCAAECLLELRAQGAQFVLNGLVSELAADELNAFTVSSQGLLFHFSPYQVAPYSQGTFQVFVAADKFGLHLARHELGRALRQLWHIL